MDLADLWPEFGESRDKVTTELGAKPGKKDGRVYRQAAADSPNPPEFLTEVLEAARRLAEI